MGRPLRLLVLLLAASGAAAAQPWRVNGVVGGSALLPPALPPDRAVREIEWTFSSASGVKIQVAEFGEGKFERPDPQDRFGERLERNGTALRVRGLERGDSGEYEARIKLLPATVEIQLFTLAVYDPVPEPEIQSERLLLSPRRCNLTLRCLLPAGSEASVSWQPDDPAGSPRGQLCGDNHTLCLALPEPAFNSVYTCVAWNPAQERRVSVRPHDLCQQEGTRGHGWCLVSVGVAALPGIGVVWVWRRRRRRRRKKAEGGAPPSCRAPPPELLYSEIQRDNSLEPRGSQDQLRTVYCELRAGP